MRDRSPKDDRVSPRAESRRARRRLLWLTILLAIGIALTRWAYAPQALDRKIRNSDELEMVLSTLDRYAGVPPTSLNWPGTVQQMAFVPVVAADYLISSGLRLSPRSFVEYLGAAYRDPWPLLLCMRGLVILISSVGFALLCVSLANRTGSIAAGVVCAGFLITNTLLWQLSFMAMADGVSLGLLAAALALLVGRELERRRVIGAAVLVGLALASKMTTVLALPLVVALLLAHTRRRAAALMLFLVVCGIALVVGCPYVLLDPLRIAKNVFGNLTKSGQPIGLGGASEMIAFETLGVLLSVAFGAALLVCVVRRRWSLLIGAAVCFGLAVVLTMCSADVFARYYGGLIPVAVVVAALAVGDFERRKSESRRGPRVRAAVAGVVVVLAVAQGVVAALDFAKPAHPGPPAVADDLAQLPAGTRVIAAGSLDDFLGVACTFADSEALRRMATRCETAMVGGASYQGFVAERAPSLAPIASTLVSLMNEEEQAFVARKRLAAGIRSRPGLDLELIAEPPFATRFGLLTPEEAIRRWRAGEADVVILDRPLADQAPTQTYGVGRELAYWRYDRPGALNSVPKSTSAPLRD
jgi:hypothetical protein